SAAPRTIAEKRLLVSVVPYTTRGWALYMNGLQSMLELGNGAAAAQTVPGPTVAASAWSHLAVSIDRATGNGRWYLNGAAIPALDFTPIGGALTNAADLYIGQVSPAFGTTAPGFQGCIDELELFNTTLP